MPVYISERADIRLISYLKDVCLVGRSSPVYDAVSTHPDIYMCRLPDGRILKSEPGEIGSSYPGNIAFNAVCLRRYFIHNLRHTNRRLYKCAAEYGLTPVGVHQGYTKCSCVVVDGKSVITADDSIYNALYGLPDVDVLKVRPGYVHLPGVSTGFLGGASGRIGDTIVFSGDITKHPDGAAICSFILDRGLNIKSFPFPLEDIGSIIEGVDI